MVIWSGWGFLTFFIGLLGVVTPALVGVDNPYVTIAGFLGAAVVNFAIGAMINRSSRDREVVDTATGEAMKLKKRSTFFFVPMQWWSVPMAAFAVLIFIQNT